MSLHPYRILPKSTASPFRVSGLDRDGCEPAALRGEAGQGPVRPRGLHRLAAEQGHKQGAGHPAKERRDERQVWNPNHRQVETDCGGLGGDGYT